jgi:hypothetical protein
MGTYQAQINSIKKYGMVGTLDIEVPLWVNTGFNVNADLSPYLPQLKAQAAAGWSYFAAEGIGRAGVATIGSVRPYINYGDENGANMYAGQYNHAPNAHFANLLESYHKDAVPAYLQSAAAAKANCKNFGLTLMMYNPSDLEQDTTALINYINQVGGVQDVLMWTGVVTDILSVFNQPWANIVSTLKTKYGFRTDAPWTTTPVPPPAVTFKEIVMTQNCADEFAWGSDGAVYHKPYGGSTWEPLGGILTSAPAAIARPGGLLDVFGRGTNSVLYRNSQVGGHWGGWNSASGGLLYEGTKPTVGSRDGVNLEVLVIGTDKAVWRNKFVGNIWLGWVREDTLIRK